MAEATKASEKKWYIIKGPGQARWNAYEVMPSTLRHLKDGCEVKGPFGSLVAAMTTTAPPSPAGTPWSPKRPPGFSGTDVHAPLTDRGA